MLQSTNHGDPMVDFDQRNIPPEDVDPDKHLVLHALLDERDKDRVALNLARQSRLDGLDPNCSHDQEMAKYLRNHMEYDRKYVLVGTAFP